MHQDKKEEALKLCLDPKVKQLVDSANAENVEYY